MLNFARFLFVFGLVFMSFGFGAATVQYKMFLYPVLLDAKVALEAWSEVLGLQFDDEAKLPAAFEQFESDGAPRPTVKAYAESLPKENDLILISGGPYQLMERCPKFGCMAWLTDRAGNISHTWEVDLDKLWEDVSHLSGYVNKLKIYPVGMHLFDNGDLIVTFQALGTFPYAAGIIRINRQGEILWKRLDYSHHWPDADAQGRIYTPAVRIIDSPVAIGATGEEIECWSGKIREDIVRVLSPDGEMLQEISLMESLAASDYSGLLYAVPDPCNATHLNSVEVISAGVAAVVEGVDEGDLLVSLRSPNLVAVLDRTSGRVKHAMAGRTIEQHSPHFLPDGRAVVFDNRGGAESQGGSRVIKVDLVAGEVQQLFPNPQSAEFMPFFSETAGHIDISPSGDRALVSVTHQGRVLEIDIPTGRVLWEYNNLHDIAAFVREQGIDSDTSIARFATYGAYYVGKPAFLN